jgi:hypothetical protein
MPRATCRCGQRLSFPADGPDRVICPKCSARIRVRRRDAADGPVAGAGALEEGDGFLRFACPCGRRLKVRDTSPRPESGRCPDCGRIVPVPGASTVRSGSVDPETSTAEMDAADVAELARWAESYAKQVALAPAPAPTPAHAATTETFHPPITSGPAAPTPPLATPLKMEAGLRVCPRCGRPVHLGAETCRQCGAHVPRR